MHTGSSLLSECIWMRCLFQHTCRQLDLQAIDLARVEVLRGPQGTLYGQGSVVAPFALLPMTLF